MGVFSSSQFLGAAVGGYFGGLIFQNYTIQGVFVFLLILQLIWLALGFALKQPELTENISIELDEQSIVEFDQLKAQLLAFKGVQQVQLLQEEKLLYLKASKKDNVRAKIQQLINKQI